MKVKVGSYWDKDSYFIGFGVTFWYHGHYSTCPQHFHIVIDLFAWYIELTIGGEDSKEKE